MSMFCRSVGCDRLVASGAGSPQYCAKHSSPSDPLTVDFHCHWMGCTEYRMNDSGFCAIHYAKHSSTSDPLDHFREHSVHNVVEEPSPGSFEGQLGQVLAELGELLQKKNKDYGSSYDKSVEKYGKTVPLIRLGDKLNRLENLILSDSLGEVEESEEETLLDLVGYGIIELVRRRRSPAK